MKKIMSILGVAALGFSLHAQGVVSMNETAFHIQTNGITSGTISTTPNSYYFTFLFSTAVASEPFGSPGSVDILDGSWTASGVMGSNQTITPLQGGINSSASGTAIDGWAAGDTHYFVVVGWSASLGSTWTQVSSELAAANSNGGLWGVNGYFGESAAGWGASTASPAPAFQLFGSSPGQVQAFTLNAVPVPEPATMALAGLGGLSLLLFRRRKS